MKLNQSRMKLHHLRNVVAVVERGSLRAGAKYLGIAQPAMSRSIVELERDLGVTLFERTKYGMTLTRSGEYFARRAKAVLADLQRTIDEMDHLSGEDRGIITLGCSTASAIAIIPTIVNRFHLKYPNVRIKVVEGALPTIETDLRDGIIDLYVGPVAPGFVDPALVIEPLIQNERMVIARRDHPLKEATRLEQLVDASWVTTPIAIDSDKEVITLFMAAGLPSPKIVMEASSGFTLATIVATSNLLAPVPRQWLDVIRVTGLMTRIPVIDLPNAPPICSVRRSNVPLTPAAEHLNDLATRAAGTHIRMLMSAPSIEALSYIA